MVLFSFLTFTVSLNLILYFESSWWLYPSNSFYIIPGLYTSVFDIISTLPTICVGTFLHARRSPFTFKAPQAIARMATSGISNDQIFKQVIVPRNAFTYEPCSFVTPILNFPPGRKSMLEAFLSSAI